MAVWSCVLWGVVGAAINRAIVFLDANKRTKGPAWRYPEGPGGGYFLLATILHCLIAAGVTSAACASSIVLSPLVEMGLGAGAPLAVKAISRMALAALGDPDSQGGGR